MSTTNPGVLYVPPEATDRLVFVTKGAEITGNQQGGPIDNPTYLTHDLVPCYSYPKPPKAAPENPISYGGATKQPHEPVIGINTGLHIYIQDQNPLEFAVQIEQFRMFKYNNEPIPAGSTDYQYALTAQWTSMERYIVDVSDPYALRPRWDTSTTIPSLTLSENCEKVGQVANFFLFESSQPNSGLQYHIVFKIWQKKPSGGLADKGYYTMDPWITVTED